MQRTYLPGVSFADVVDGVPQPPADFHNNQIGTTRVLSDLGGAIARRNVYTAFGELVWSTRSTTTRYGYVGAEGYQEDPATGLIHVGARYYDPSIGRFLQRDPIGIRGGLNTYGYAANDPATGVDLDGFRRVNPKVIKAAGGAGAGVLLLHEANSCYVESSADKILDMGKKHVLTSRVQEHYASRDSKATVPKGRPRKFKLKGFKWIVYTCWVATITIS